MTISKKLNTKKDNIVKNQMKQKNNLIFKKLTKMHILENMSFPTIQMIIYKKRIDKEKI